MAIVATLLMAAGCTAPGPRWTLTAPDGPRSPWMRVLPSVVFSNAPLPQVAADLERLANAVAQPVVKLSVAEPAERVTNDVEPLRITFQADQIQLRDALQIVGELTGYRPVYGPRQAFLAPVFHADGQAPVTVHGYCRSRVNRQPISRFTMICTRKAMMFDDEPTTSTYDIQTTTNGGFSVSIPVSAYSDVVTLGGRLIVSDDHPTPQRMRIIAISDAHLPSRLDVGLVESNVNYVVDIEMHK